MKVEINYKEDVFEPKGSGVQITVNLPIISLLVAFKHQSGPYIPCYLDSGATINLFPKDYAITYLGFSEKTLNSGRESNVLGIGGVRKLAFGHLCTLHHPNFRLENTWIYFMEDQTIPLLGRLGFMNRFDSIVFNEKEKKLELINPR